MPRPSTPLLLVHSSLLLIGSTLSLHSVTADDQRGIDFFEKRIRPVLVESCYQCHSDRGDGIKGGLRLDTQPGMASGGDSGPAIVAGDPEGSLLVEAIRYDGLEMPPEGKLADEIIADIEAWIQMGAPVPRQESDSAPEPETVDFEKAKQFWSFRCPEPQSLPTLSDPRWMRRRSDAFILARLDRSNLQPGAEADSPALIRRVHFDLTGLPPTPDEVRSFSEYDSPDAYDRVVDRLLASPQFGERWTRMWLDVARYAEDQAHIVGNNKELFYPNAYLYRDWIMDALNSDLAYDQFVRLQIAADLLDSADPSDLAALGFLGLGPKYYRRRSPEVMADEWEDRVDTVARGLLGLTVACARCHDHKFDPIETEDYYALAGTFASTEMFNQPLDTKRKTGSDGQAKNPEDSFHIVRDGEPTDLNVFIRGDINKKGPIVPRRFLRVLCAGEPEPFRYGSGRLELASAIADPTNPLTARVFVNRIWARNFGRPLVGTPSNFGNLGARPTHPQLLDDLAVRFMSRGWSPKWLLREIVLSSAYTQTSNASRQALLEDPDNLLLSHMNRRRLDVEAWRDAILFAAGRLQKSTGGKSVDPGDEDVRRRTVYSYISRLDLNPMLALFDFPDPNAHSAGRSLTTTPLQKLFVLNAPFMVFQAESLVERIMSVRHEDEAARIRSTYWHLFGRAPTEEEICLGLEFLATADEARAAMWSQFVQVLLASNEMFTVD